MLPLVFLSGLLVLNWLICHLVGSGEIAVCLVWLVGLVLFAVYQFVLPFNSTFLPLIEGINLQYLRAGW